MTHHSPVGALSSFTFGALGKGVSIDMESPRIQEVRYDLYAGYSQSGNVMALPFREGIVLKDDSIDAFAEGNKEVKQEKKNRWNNFTEEQIVRTLTPCIDRFEAGRMSLEIYTPHSKMEDYEKVYSTDNDSSARCCV